MVSPRPHRVIVVGGGFGGLQAATHLTTAPVELTLVDRRNFHLFQPLTYQVATGALSPGEVCYPLRAIFRRHQNVQVVLGEVAGFDVDRRRLDVRPVVGEGVTRSLEYDTLIVAGGSHYSYFGHDEWRDAAPEVKSLESALAVRARLLAAFEAAELDDDEARRRAWLTFVVVGAGPTGVEMAGQIAELARDTLRRDFRSIDPRHARVLLVEAADRVLTAFPPSLSRRAALQLEDLGVTPALECTVVGIDEEGVTVAAASGEQVGGGGHRVGTGAPPRRADRRRARPGGPHRRRARPYAARAPGGARARRHGPRPRRPGRAAGPPRRGARRHAAGPVRRRARSRPAARPAESAVPLPRQGQRRNHRSRPRGGGPARGPPQRLPGVDHVARRPSLLPRRLPEPSARAHQLG
ncbi:MAG: FAD-dependent oxidoreductase, partial [Geodermatophilales bacterium]|nr:FAD-dependent oxidoreductase [Geodermatophilales bacterium]